MARAHRRGQTIAIQGRRSQAERTARTRQRIVAAVFESIAEVGLARTTAVQITQRAGVTWGAVQHHFGGKDGILIAAVEDSFDHFASRFGDLPTAGTPLDERARRFVDGAWAHFGSREYRSAFEILLHYIGRDDLSDTPSWRNEMFRSWDRVWMELFHDSKLRRSEHRAIEHYTISVLAGLASTRMLEGGAAQPRDEELGFLKDTLVRELGRQN
ncbi:MAG: TetR/AcrR family transcriptional regulator [Myxococcota bacterium]